MMALSSLTGSDEVVYAEVERVMVVRVPEVVLLLLPKIGCRAPSP
jgi:hypothetical protein